MLVAVLWVYAPVFQPGDPKRMVIETDYTTMDQCWQARAKVWEKVVSNYRWLNGGWIESIECRRVPVEGKQ